jgi:hypothetical protein
MVEILPGKARIFDRQFFGSPQYDSTLSSVFSVRNSLSVIWPNRRVPGARAETNPWICVSASLPRSLCRTKTGDVSAESGQETRVSLDVQSSESKKYIDFRFLFAILLYGRGNGKQALPAPLPSWLSRAGSRLLISRRSPVLAKPT